MLKNLNDYLTFFTLILLVILTLRFSFRFFFAKDDDQDDESLWELLSNYRENEED